MGEAKRRALETKRLQDAALAARAAVEKNHDPERVQDAVARALTVHGMQTGDLAMSAAILMALSLQDVAPETRDCVMHGVFLIARSLDPRGLPVTTVG